MENDIEITEVFTPQELYLIGGTRDLPPELVKTDSDFYKPLSILSQKLTPEETIQKRNEIKHFPVL